MERSELRPRSVGEVLDAAIRLALSNARALVTLVACVVIPLQLVWAIVLLATVSRGSEVPTSLLALHFHFVREPNGTVRNTAPHLSGGVTSAELVVSTFVQVLSTAACVRALGDAVAGAAPSVAGSLWEMARRLPALIGLYVARFVGLVVGLVLFIVPGIWLAGAWSVSVPALVLEGAGPWHAMQRSRGLVRHRWWPVIGVIVVADLAIGIISSALQALLTGVDGFSSHPALVPAVIASVLGATIVALLVQPFNAAVRTVLYLDLRIRRGGEELVALGDQIGVEIPAPAASPHPERPSADPPYWPPPPGWRPEGER